ncbi:hypothetical protein [Phaffia rhodozyma]|uniref:Uncharacterized protein n=1 Tax=Phaffia rhodozyma TaxID=264483 RepID=A0A0F7SN62_PHARH|nr:hypothetical protein [Phaffia rhodozyma]
MKVVGRGQISLLSKPATGDEQCGLTLTDVFHVPGMSSDILVSLVSQPALPDQRHHFQRRHGSDRVQRQERHLSHRFTTLAKPVVARCDGSAAGIGCFGGALQAGDRDRSRSQTDGTSFEISYA